MKLRNIAIIAHVDHGKTTLVDRMLHQVRLFRDNEQVDDLILDSNDLERERGITILSKNVSIRYSGHKINIIDTPGHVDFGGEVERVLNMADGVLLIVDSFEGPMPQTRFVLQKAIELGHKIIVVINKVDKANCNPDETNEKVFELMFALDASEEQLNYPVIYGSSKQGWMSLDWKQPTADITCLLDAIIEHFDEPEQVEGPLQVQISSVDYSTYTGRIAIGRVHRGQIKMNDKVMIVQRNGHQHPSEVKELFLFEGLGKEKTKSPVHAGEIVAIVGLDDFDIGDTVTDHSFPEALPSIAVDEPTMCMLFTINNSPFFGKEGKYVTSRHLRERLMREMEKNLALRVEDTDSPDRMMVFGRGILHLSILIETMRREGFELQIGQPHVVTKDISGHKHEPVEILHVSVPDEYSGKVIEAVSLRKGDILSMETKSDRLNLEFKIPARGLIGLTTPLLTLTGGKAVISHRFKGYEPWKGEIQSKRNGSLIAHETGTTIAYAIDKLQDRGQFFVEPNVPVYGGQIVGENTRSDDITVNVIRSKKLTNMRASGADEKSNIAPPRTFSLEEAMEYIRDDEYVEVTPESIRIRKILLKEHERKRLEKSKS